MLRSSAHELRGIRVRGVIRYRQHRSLGTRPSEPRGRSEDVSGLSLRVLSSIPACRSRPFGRQFSTRPPCCPHCAGRLCTSRRGRLWFVLQPAALPEGPWFSRPELTERASWTSRPRTRTTTCSALGQVGLYTLDAPELNSPKTIFRHAWLQVGGTSSRGNFEGQGPTDLPGYAGSIQSDQNAPLFDPVSLRRRHL